jgi:predicted DsbA family dithiol-disulfide isomerase
VTRPVVAWLYGDLVCPWSYLALGRLRRIEARLPVAVGWRPLRRSRDETAAVPDLRATAGRSADAEDEPGRGLAALDLPYDPPPRVPDSSAALRAVEFAADLGPRVRDRVLDGLFRAHFSGEVRLDDRSSLLAACDALGLDREGLGPALEDGRYDAELSAAEAEADRYGIDAVPVLLLGRRKVIGAAPVELLATLVRQALADD